MRRKLRRFWLKARYYGLWPLLIFPGVPLLAGAVIHFRRGGTFEGYLVAVFGEDVLYIGLPIAALIFLFILSPPEPAAIRLAREATSAKKRKSPGRVIDRGFITISAAPSTWWPRS